MDDLESIEWPPSTPIILAIFPSLNASITPIYKMINFFKLYYFYLYHLPFAVVTNFKSFGYLFTNRLITSIWSNVNRTASLYWGSSQSTYAAKNFLKNNTMS